MTFTWFRHLRSLAASSLVFVFVSSALIADAKTQYVSDELVINLREGKGNEYKIIKMLRNGTPLNILEEAEQYLKVRTEEGLEGWVLKQYITSETPKTAIIAERDRLSSLLGQCSGDKVSLQNELKTAKLSVTETESLRKEISRLERLQILWWFLAGGGVFLVGWITGRVSRKKRYSSF